MSGELRRWEPHLVLQRYVTSLSDSMNDGMTKEARMTIDESITKSEARRMSCCGRTRGYI